MPLPRPAPRHARRALLIATLLVSGCGAPATERSTPAPTDRPIAEATQTPPVTPTPTPTPSPTPTYTNRPDPELSALIPARLRGRTVVKPTALALTPGDVGTVFGPIGARFRSLVVAYVEQPRLTLFAMRMDPPRARTRDLARQLPEIGRYLGISGLDPAPWKLEKIGDKQVWTRPEDEATAAGTRLYTWIAGDLVFLMIGTDAALNNAMLAALPGP